MSRINGAPPGAAGVAELEADALQQPRPETAAWLPTPVTPASDCTTVAIAEIRRARMLDKERGEGARKKAREQEENESTPEGQSLLPSLAAPSCAISSVIFILFALCAHHRPRAISVNCGSGNLRPRVLDRRYFPALALSDRTLLTSLATCPCQAPRGHLLVTV